MRSDSSRRGFTFLEVMVVLVMIGILTAVVIPRFTGVAEDARASATIGDLAGVRSSIAAFRAKNVISGTAAYPTLGELTTAGTVIEGGIPANPFSKLSNVQGVSLADATARVVTGADSVGWNYYVDNSASPPIAIFYANSSTTTTVGKSGGGYKGANEL